MFVAPLDVRLAEDTVIEPDVLVARRDDVGPKSVLGPPVLAVEVLSPRTRLTDLNHKKSRLERAGCGSYWVVDPGGPSLTAWDLVDGEFVEVGLVEGDEPFHATLPYPVTVVPSALLG